MRFGDVYRFEQRLIWAHPEFVKEKPMTDRRERARKFLESYANQDPWEGVLTRFAENEVFPILQSETRLRNALRMLLDDSRFQVSVGGNPIAVEKMLAEARLALDPDPTP